MRRPAPCSGSTRHQLPADYPSLRRFYRTKRSLAIGGNKLIVPTIDMHVIALDVKTGTSVWDVVTDDYKSRRTYNSGPLVIKDKVLVGAGNCSPGHANSRLGTYAGVFPPGGCFITGHDLETGKQLWRFNTIAQPGRAGRRHVEQPAGRERGGGAIWVARTVRPGAESDVLGHRVALAVVDRHARHLRRGRALYMNSTLALNPDTGKLVWHYQHIGDRPVRPGLRLRADHRDRELSRDSPRKAVITAGKPGIFEVLDAATGQFLFARRSGRAERRHRDRSGDGSQDAAPEPLPAGVTRCPGNMGARNFLAGSYSPSTNRYYLPIIDICMGKMGDTPARFLALDLQTLEFAWDIRTRSRSRPPRSRPRGPAVFGDAGSLFPRVRRPRRQGAVGKPASE